MTTSRIANGTQLRPGELGRRRRRRRYGMTRTARVERERAALGLLGGLVDGLVLLPLGRAVPRLVVDADGAAEDFRAVEVVHR